jgi:hypothetical protein
VRLLIKEHESFNLKTKQVNHLNISSVHIVHKKKLREVSSLNFHYQLQGILTSIENGEL